MTETAFGYTRLSQKSDEQSGLSIENQAYEITQHCIRNNIKLLKIWNEGFYPGDRNRPVFTQMLSIAISLKPKYIIGRDSSRFARDASMIIDVYDNMEAQGIKFVSLTEGAMLEFKIARDINAVISEMLRTRGKIFQREMMERKKQQGLPYGHPPLGYNAQKDPTKPNYKSWIVNTENGKKVRFIFDAWNKGHNIINIAHDINMSPSGVWKVINNKVYIGIFEYKILIKDKDKKIIETIEGEYKLHGQIRQVLSREMWDKAQTRIVNGKIRPEHYMIRTIGKDRRTYAIQ